MSSDSQNQSNTSGGKMTPEQEKAIGQAFIMGIIAIVAVFISLSAIFAIAMYLTWTASSNGGLLGKWVRVSVAFLTLSILCVAVVGISDVFPGYLPVIHGGELFQYFHTTVPFKMFAGKDFVVFRDNLESFTYGSLALSSVLFLILLAWRTHAKAEKAKIPISREQLKSMGWAKSFFDFVEKWVRGPFEFLFLILSLPLSFAGVAIYQRLERATTRGTAAFFSMGLIAAVLTIGWVLRPTTYQSHSTFTLFIFLMAAFFIGGLGAFYQIFIRAMKRTGSPEDEKILQKEKIRLGKTILGDPYSIPVSALTHHMQVVGASGFGKTNFLTHILFHHIEHHLGMLFIDLKADTEMVDQIISHCKRHNRLSSLKIFSAGHPDLSIPYNLFRHGDASELKDKLIGAFEWSEVFYQKEAESFLLRVLRALVHLRDSKNLLFHLGDIYECLTNPKALLLIANELPPEARDLKEDLFDLELQLKNPSKYEKFQGVRTDIELLIKAEFGPLLCSGSGGLDLWESMQKGDIIYILLDSRRYGKTAERLGKMILQDLSTNTGKRGQIPKEERRYFTVMIDEFADLVTESFSKLIGQARSANVGIIVAHQELADLRRESEALQNQIMQNTATTVAFLQKVQESAETLAGMIGTYEAKEITRQRNENNWLTPKQTGMGSEKDVDRYLVHPNEFKRLQRGECVIISKYPEAIHERVTIDKVSAESEAVTDDEFKEINQWQVHDEVALNLKGKVRGFERSVVTNVVAPPPPPTAEPTSPPKSWT